MPYSPVAIPEISISPAPPQELIVEPYSPFSSIKFQDNGDDFRPRLLTPPPSSPRRTRSSSSPSPASGGYNSDEERFDYNEGLDKQRFEALLQATRERNAKRAPDLRKEVTLKAHNAKQFERRARFITRVLVGPLIPTVSSSLAPPAVSLSSPDAVASFKQSNTKANVAPSFDKKPEIKDESFMVSRGTMVPSLEDISSRMNSQGYICIPRSKQYQSSNPERCITANRPAQLQLPRGNVPIQAPQPLPSPRTYGQLMSSTDPDPTRASRAHMLSTLKRRTSPPIQSTEVREVDDKKRKRYSAPGDLFPLQTRTGFQHPVLAIPGAF